MLKQLRVYYSILLISALTSTVLHAQKLETPTADEGRFGSLIHLYGLKHYSPVLFVHLDKNIYSNNENVWFTGYVLNNTKELIYNTLSLALIRDRDRRVVLDDRFVMSGAFCFGNTVIPDSVKAGAYTIIAYGNRLENNQPDILFTQQITVKTESAQTMNASLNALDTAANAASQKVMLLVSFNNEQFPPKSVPVTYYIGDALKPVKTGAAKTANGQYIFNIPSEVLTARNNKLNVQVKYNAEVQNLSMVLPVPPQPAQVRFFPEGGNMLNGIANQIGWEAKKANGEPMNADAVLYEDNKVIDTISTQLNGLGRFYLTPQKLKKYTVRLIAGSDNTEYILPEATGGAALSVKQAVVDEALLVDVYNDEPTRKLYLVGHNYKQIFFETAIQKSPGQRVKILLANIPRGVMQLTLVDSNGRPYAERMVFAHYTNKTKLNISTDNASYNSRKKVKLSIKLTGQDPVAAVSVAVVQQNRIDANTRTTIEDYLYVENNLGQLPVKASYFNNEVGNKRDLENILLVKGWSRYKWTDVLKIKPNDTIKLVTKPVFTAKATPVGKKIKGSLPVATVNPFNTYNTDNSGFFVLPDTGIITEAGKKVAIFVPKGTPSDYRILVKNPYDTINKQMAAQISPVVYHSPALENSNYLKMPGTERAIRLTEVKIKANKDDDFFGSGPNACGDYVCFYNILNCPNHREHSGNRKPVKGGVYQGAGNSNITYQGCQETEGTNQFKGIYTAQEFYPSDYSEINPSQPEYISTLYWKSQLMLNQNQAQELSFYTSDITGPFKIIVQGITNSDVIYGEASFRVTK